MPGSLDRQAVALVLVALALLTVGCASSVSTTDEGEPSPPSGDTAAAAFSDIETLNATIEWQFDRPTENETLRYHYVVKPHQNKVWEKQLAPSALAGNLEISNGSVIWAYNATENHVRIQQYEGVNRTSLVDRKLQYIFDRLNESSETDQPAPSVGVSPLPVVPSGQGQGNLSLANVSLAYGGIERVAGRRAHVVRIEANTTTTGLRNQTIWFDTETFYQLRAETVLETDEGVTRITQRAEDVAFDEQVPADRFEFDPPPDATVEQAGSIQLQTYSTRAALAGNVSMSLPDPALSETFTYTEGRHIVRQDGDERTEVTSQIFTRQVNSLVVLKSTNTDPFANLTANESVRAVSVGEQDGFFLDQPRSVIWTCDGYLYQVVGQFPRDRLLGIAESMVCE